MEMEPSCLKDLNSVLSKFNKRPMLLAACFSLCSRDSVGVGLFRKNA